MNIVAEGVVGVRDLATGTEWDEAVVVPERAVDSYEPVEDTARRIARSQTEGQVETLGCDIS